MPDASKQRDERALKSRMNVYSVRLAPSPEPTAGTPEDLRRHRQRQLLRAQLEVATIMEALGIDRNELVHIKQELLQTQQKLRKTELELDEAREKARAHASHERDAATTSRALSRRTQEQCDYIAVVEQQLTTVRSRLQEAERQIAEMVVFRQRSEQLVRQLGQERLRSRQKDAMISELKQREEDLQRQVRTLTLQRDEAPGRKDIRRRMQRLQLRENAMGQVLASVAGTVSVLDVPSSAWEAAQEPTLRSPMWKQLQLEQELDPPSEPQRDEHVVQVAVAPQSPQPPAIRPAGNGPRPAGRSRRLGERILRGKKAQLEHMKRRLRYVLPNLR